MEITDHNFEGEPAGVLEFTEYLIESSGNAEDDNLTMVDQFTPDAVILETIGAWDPEKEALHPDLCDADLMTENIAHIRDTGVYSPRFLQAMGEIFVEEIEQRAKMKRRLKKTYRGIKTASITYSLLTNELSGFATSLVLWGTIDRALVRHADYLPAQIAFLEELMITQLAGREMVNFNVSELIRRGIRIDDLKINKKMVDRYYQYRRSIRELLELNYSPVRAKGQLSKHRHSPFFLTTDRSSQVKADEVLRGIRGQENQWRAYVVRETRDRYPGLNNREVLEEFRGAVREMRNKRRDRYRERRMDYFNRERD